MPAPLAKGLILATTIIIAASLSLYENPHLRDWILENRRKLLVAIHGEAALSSAPDASEEEEKARELALAEKARRDAHIRKNLYLHGLNGGRARGSSFDDFVTDEGRLREKEEGGEDEEGGEEAGARRRAHVLPLDTLNPSTTSSFALPKSQQQQQLHHRNRSFDTTLYSRSSTPTVTSSPAHTEQLTPTSSPGLSVQGRGLAVAEREEENYFSFSEDTVNSDRAAEEEEEEEEEERNERYEDQLSRARGLDMSMGQSMAQTAYFGGTGSEHVESRGAGMDDERSECGSTADWVSEPGISTPGSWTEVGSVVSEEDVALRH